MRIGDERLQVIRVHAGTNLGEPRCLFGSSRQGRIARVARRAIRGDAGAFHPESPLVSLLAAFSGKEILEMLAVAHHAAAEAVEEIADSAEALAGL